MPGAHCVRGWGSAYLTPMGAIPGNWA